MVSADNKIFKAIFSIDNSNNTLHLTFSDKDLKIVLNTPTKNDNEILRMLNDILNNEYNENTYEVFTYLIDDYISDSKKVLLIEDILPSEVRDIVIESYSNMLDPIKNNILNDRLSYISHNNDNMLLLASNNNDDNYKDTIRKKSSNNTYELWSKISYNYGHDFNNSSNNIHTMGITLGMDYDINNDKYKIGFAYMFNIGNGIDDKNKKIIKSNSISLYGKINNIINNKDFINMILTYGRLNINKDKNNSSLKVIIDRYDLNSLYLVTIFGYNINDNITSKISLNYNYISRNNYQNSLGFNIYDLHINVISPSIGMDYMTYINKDNSLSLKTSITLEYNFVISNKDNLNIAYTGINNGTLIYKNDNNNYLNTKVSLGINYNPKSNISLSTNTYTSYNTNNYMNVGVSIEGRWRIR